MNVDKEIIDTCISCLTKELPFLRKMNHLTQKDLAEILGISRQTITNIESGSSKMKWSVFLAIMFIFNLDHKTSDYLKTIEMPYSDLKEWFIKKSRRSTNGL